MLLDEPARKGCGSHHKDSLRAGIFQRKLCMSGGQGVVKVAVTMV
jgi:hypothetical protein